MTEATGFAASDIVLVYVACADRDEARRIGRSLVARHLAACVHIGDHEALYWWQDRIAEEPEAHLLVKTTGARYPEARDHILAGHGHALPGLTAWAVSGHAPFLGWITASCAKPEPG